ncbi:ABC transporter substrate-binding protein [Protaetiibacter intestinalis]|uniref:Nitrate ABC transporter substrate-binding protein n=1 Tax=Protaetiibacter intestinalis TaxID=2419774 RepID=A0A387BAQ3_9MICO|nr:ABC transporter substrate-binding protein [Protaetiibacter intestinalis]AYF98216.1 nitrate ABC transporter substrate-binding protein [Protaetiibacter intestinalis]
MRKSLSVVALGAAAALALAGCSGPSTTPGDTTAPDDGELTAVTVGVIPIVDVAPIYLGVQKGFFEEEGLDVTLELAQGGAAIVPAVVSGEYQFGFSNLTSLMLARTNDVPIKAIAAGNFTTGAEPDFAAVVVPADSDIQSAADLAGHTVAVNTLNNIGDSTVRNVVEQDGGDPSSLQFVEMGFPDMPAAIADHQVDAAWILEPHLTRALQAGARVVSWNYAETDPNLMIASYFTSDQLIASDPDLVDAFISAMNKSLEYAEANPDETRAALDEYTEIDPAVKEAMVMPRFSSEFTSDSFQLLADLALKYGLVTDPIDVSAVIK